MHTVDGDAVVVSLPSTAKRIAAGVLAILCAVAYGVLHSLDGVMLVSYLRANPHLRRILKSCLIVNTYLFVSLWAASLLFYPSWAFNLWSRTGAAPPAVNAVGGNIISSSSSSGGGLGIARRLWFPVFSLVWVLPMYGLTQALGVRWYSALYAEAYAEKKRRAVSGLAASGSEQHVDSGPAAAGTPTDSAAPPSLKNVVVSISEIVFKSLVTAIFAVVAVVVETVVPTALGGHYLAFMMNSWLYALYVFDYRLSSQYIYDRRLRRQARVTLTSSLKLFERNWAYFLGFGATQSIIIGALRSSWIASSWFSVAAVTSVLFGAHVVLSVEATPGPRAPFSLPILTPLFALCGKVLGIVANAMQ